jgi:hypothetical protein
MATIGLLGISVPTMAGAAALAEPAAVATASVPRTPLATPARIAIVDALRRGFRWLRM